jgi:hypothetical protein
MRDGLTCLVGCRGRDGAPAARCGLAAVLALLGACGGSSSEVQPAGSAGAGGAQGQAGAGGTSAGGTSGGVAGTTGGAAAGGRGGDTGAGGAGVGGTSTAGTGGTGSGGSSGACPARTTFTIANHDILNVTWPSGLATMGGSGPVHIWTKVTFAAAGSGLNATAQACGSNLPPTMLSALAGGGNVQIEIPNAAWDSPSMPKFMFPATQTGWDPGSKITYSSNALVGFTTDPGATWPAANTGIMARTDADGDGSPALTALPKIGGGFVAPPTSILQLTRVDKVYIVTRNSTSVTITRTACDQVSTVSTYAHFDNHVVGCHVMGGGECTATEANFVDTNRTIYEVTTATVQSKVVPDSVSCADIRAMLAM